MSAHAELAPSGTARWASCHASVKASIGVEQSESEWALEGTLAATKLEHWLELGVPPTDGILYEQLEYAYEYVLDLERQGFETFFERKVTYSKRIWGKPDILAIRKKKLRIGDLKMGYRLVEPKNNGQMATYGVCTEEELGVTFDDVEFAIIQPRVSHKDGFVRRWQAPPDFLDWHRQEIETAIRYIDADNPAFYPGKHCQYCKVEGFCKPATNHFSAMMTGEGLFL